MPRPLRFGVTLPQIKRSWQEVREAATCFDSLGFDSLWVCDHLLGVPNPQAPILGGQPPVQPIDETHLPNEMGCVTAAKKQDMKLEMHLVKHLSH